VVEAKTNKKAGKKPGESDGFKDAVKKVKESLGKHMAPKAKKE